MDATRVRDNLQVMFKKVLPEEAPHELSEYQPTIFVTRARNDAK